MVWAAFLCTMAEERRVVSRYNSYLDCFVQIVLVDDTVLEIAFDEEPDPDTTEEHDLLDRIDRYLSGTGKDEFTDVEIELTGGERERRVLETVRSIPYGKDMTVEAIVRDTEGFSTSDEADHEFVREVLDRNPIPLIIPDHRVRDGPSPTPPRVEQRLRSLENIVS